MDGKLCDQMRSGPKSVQPQPPRITGHPIRTITDQSGAQQRRRVQIVVRIRQFERIARIGHGVRRVKSNRGTAVKGCSGGPEGLKNFRPSK